VVDTFVRAIEISDFERRLQLVEADCSNYPGAAVDMYGAGRGGYYHLQEKLCCRFAAYGGGCNNRFNSWLRSADRPRRLGVFAQMPNLTRRQLPVLSRR
jgi:hypothetical protein